MKTTDNLIAELTREAVTTRRVLERVPEDRLSWAPHPKSMTLGQLALHIAEIPGAVPEFLAEPMREVPDFGGRPEARSQAELLAALDENVANGTRRLTAWDDKDLEAAWTMVHGTETVFSVPRFEMIRSIMFNHWYHHRGELLVYLRLLDQPVPSVYGPSADENPFAPA